MSVFMMFCCQVECETGECEIELSFGDPSTAAHQHRKSHSKRISKRECTTSNNTLIIRECHSANTLEEEYSDFEADKIKCSSTVMSSETRNIELRFSLLKSACAYSIL